MSKSEKTLSKTERILTIYHLFIFCEEVSKQELRNCLRGFSEKTISRDISLMKRAGVPIHFSKRRDAYVLKDNDCDESQHQGLRAPDYYGYNNKEKQFLDKIIRLTIVMSYLPEKDCDVWYRETFPDISRRTMQRDFAILKNIGPGYVIYYKREWENPDDKDDELPPGHYYFDDDQVSTSPLSFSDDYDF
jgi:predicted DNA-binding transcriptional regulator YafY